MSLPLPVRGWKRRLARFWMPHWKQISMRAQNGTIHRPTAMKEESRLE